MIVILLLLILLVLLFGSGAVLTVLGIGAGIFVIGAAIFVILGIIGFLFRALFTLFGDWDEGEKRVRPERGFGFLVEAEARANERRAEERPPAKQLAAGKRAAALKEEEALLHWYEFATGAAKEKAVDKDLAQTLLRLYRAQALLRLYKRKYRLSLWNQWALESLWKAIADAGELAPADIEIPHGAMVVGIELWHHCFMDLAERNRLVLSSAQRKFPHSQRRLEHLGVIGVRNNIAWLNDVLIDFS
jgi:hypothetical protein